MKADLAQATDAELAARARAGEQPAFAALVERYRETLYRILVRSTGDADAALDLLQEAFVAAYRALGRYDPARPMRAWLTAIALNKCRDWARRRAVRRLFVRAAPIDAAAEAVADPAAGPEALEVRDSLARVARAVAALPATLREVLVLRAIEGLSQAEAAQTLRISEKAVETRLARARRTLAERVGREIA